MITPLKHQRLALRRSRSKDRAGSRHAGWCRPQVSSAVKPAISPNHLSAARPGDEQCLAVGGGRGDRTVAEHKAQLNYRAALLRAVTGAIVDDRGGHVYMWLPRRAVATNPVSLWPRVPSAVCCSLLSHSPRSRGFETALISRSTSTQLGPSLRWDCQLPSPTLNWLPAKPGEFQPGKRGIVGANRTWPMRSLRLGRPFRDDAWTGSVTDGPRQNCGAPQESISQQEPPPSRGFFWSRVSESNRRPLLYKRSALPTELTRRCSED